MSDETKKVSPISPREISKEGRKALNDAGNESIRIYKEKARAIFEAEGKAEAFEATWPNIIASWATAIAAASGKAVTLDLASGTGQGPEGAVRAIMGALEQALGQHVDCNDPECPVHGKGKRDDAEPPRFGVVKGGKSYLN